MNVAKTSAKRKPNHQKAANCSPDAIIEASLGLLTQFPDGFIYPGNPTTKVPRFRQYNSVRRTADDLRVWLADFPRTVPAIIPGSFGLLAIDGDEGEPDELLEALAENKIDFLVAESKSRGWHVYVRCKLARSRIPGKWAAFGASGDLRYNGNILLYGDTVLRLREFLQGRGNRLTGSLRDELVAQVDFAGRTARPYDTVTMAHGRSVYNAALKQQDTPAWAGAVAQVQGMKGADIKANELRAIEDARERMEWARSVTADVQYRGRIRDTFTAMVAFAADGLCWASHASISAVAGIPNNDRKTVWRHLQRLEKDGLIERSVANGQSWRGSPTVAWRIVRQYQTAAQ